MWTFSLNLRNLEGGTDMLKIVGTHAPSTKMVVVMNWLEKIATAAQMKTTPYWTGLSLTYVLN